MLTSGDVVLNTYEVYVSGDDDEGPDVITIGEEARALLSSTGILNLTDSCWPELEIKNLRLISVGSLHLNIGALMDVPHGATRVNTGMFIFGYRLSLTFCGTAGEIASHGFIVTCLRHVSIVCLWNQICWFC
jgi:hypothetical protein